MRTKLIATLATGGLLAAALGVALLRGEAATEQSAAPLTRAGADAARSLPVFTEDAPPAAGETPLVPGRARLTVNLPRGVRIAGEVKLRLRAASGAWNEPRSLRDSATWEDLAPGDYVLESWSAGWTVPQPRLELAAGDPREQELVAANFVEGLVLGARSGRPQEDVLLSVVGRVPLAGGDEAQHTLYHETLHLPGGAFHIAGLDVGSDVDAVQVRAVVQQKHEDSTGWLPLSNSWAGLVLRVPDVAVRGRITAAEPPQAPVAGAHVALVPADIPSSGVRLAGSDLYLAPAAPGGPAQATFGETLSDDTGEYALLSTNAPPTARLLAFAPDRLPALSPVVSLPLGAPPADVDLVLGQGAEVRVLVHVPALPAADGGEPRVDEEPRRASLEAVGAGSTGILTEWLRRCEGAAPGEADFDARFAGVAPGEYLVSAMLMAPEQHAEGRLLRRRFVVTEGGPLLVELRAEDPPLGVTLRGHALLPADMQLGPSYLSLVRRGAPIDGATMPQALARLQPDGHFELSAVMPGEHALLLQVHGATYTDLALGVVAITVGEAAPPELRIDLASPEIRLRAPAELRGSKLTLAGTTASPELDSLLALDYVGVVVSDDEAAEGRIFGLPTGRYVLRRDGEAMREFEVGVAPITIDLR